MISAKSYTDQGGREYNEDAGIYACRNGISYAVIADGLGGHGNGDKASRMAVGTIRKRFQDLPDCWCPSEEDLVEWFDEANQNVMALQDERCQMKTTLAFLCIDEKEKIARLAHVGDSRIYYFEEGRCAFYTFDHSVSRMAVLSGEIGIEDIRFHVDRNKLLKAIGKSEGVKAETKTISLAGQSEQVFLLCTDGFWEYVTEEEMEYTLSQSDSPEKWIKLMREYIAQRAGEHNDNNSAIAVWVTD